MYLLKRHSDLFLQAHQPSAHMQVGKGPQTKYPWRRYLPKALPFRSLGNRQKIGGAERVRYRDSLARVRFWIAAILQGSTGA